MKSGYAIAWMEPNDIFAHGFDNTGNIVSSVDFEVEELGELPVLWVRTFYLR